MTRHSGVESCSSGARVDAVHHTMLTNTVGAANIVKEVKIGTDTEAQDLNPSV